MITMVTGRARLQEGRVLERVITPSGDHEPCEEQDQCQPSDADGPCREGNPIGSVNDSGD